MEDRDIIFTTLLGIIIIFIAGTYFMPTIGIFEGSNSDGSFNVNSSNIKGNYLSFFAENSIGGENANLDCSPYVEANCLFKLQPPINESWIISRMMVQIEDGGSIDSGGYGNGGALTNGIILTLNQEDYTLNLTNSQPIKTNLHWSKFSYDTIRSNFGAGNEYLDVRWTFAKSGTYIELDGSKNESIDIIIQDDVDNLVGHYFLFQGYIEE